MSDRHTLSASTTRNTTSDNDIVLQTDQRRRARATPLPRKEHRGGRV